MDQNRLRELLQQIYEDDAAEAVLEEIVGLIRARKSYLKARTEGLDQRDSLLITYPDQIQEEGTAPLRTLADFCKAYLAETVSGVHVLPFYPWTSDDGFSVVDYRQVSPDYGTWEDIEELRASFRLMFDAVINHVSAESDWFNRMKAGDPRYEGWFIVPPDGADLTKVVRPRALPLLTPFKTTRGVEYFWTTFSADQVDLNYKDPRLLLEITDLLLFYAGQGADFLRMDAIAYLWKEPGTTCIHLPQTHALIRLFRAVLDEAAPQVSIITETNVPHAENVSYFGDGTNEARLVYNFSLPPLVLHAFQTGSSQRLSEWAKGLERPSGDATFFNFLASHDGIGLNPLRGILSEAEIGKVVARCKTHGGLVSYKAVEGGDLLPYELNINYFDALNPPESDESLEIQVDRFVSAHAILLALSGVPGVYFHSLFGSRGWPEGVNATGRNRTINRQKLQRAELEAELADPGSRRARVFGRLSQLLKLRSAHRAFHPFGSQEVIDAGARVFALLRTDPGGEERALCLHNVSAEEHTLPAGVLKTLRPLRGTRDIITGRHVSSSRPLALQPYETVWLM